MGTLRGCLVCFGVVMLLGWIGNWLFASSPQEWESAVGRLQPGIMIYLDYDGKGPKTPVGRFVGYTVRQDAPGEEIWRAIEIVRPDGKSGYIPREGFIHNGIYFVRRDDSARK